MNKELANLQDLKNAFISHCKTLGCEDTYIKVCENKFGNIETALKEKEKQDEILPIIISKRIDFDKLQRCANAYEYNAEVDSENNEEETTRQHITQEEYDTLEKMGLIY